MLVSLLQSQSLSTKPGIYLFLDEKGKILYIGKAKNLKKRVNSYFTKYVALGPKTQALVSKVSKIKTITVDSEIEAFLLEAKYIRKYKPKYNIKLTDDKAYPMIKITLKDLYPKVLVVRKADDNPSAEGSIYFGPFPNSAGALRLTLKTIRKIFPYQSVLNHPNRICLFYHLALCPCPPVFSAQGGQASGWDSKQFKKDYKKTIRHIIDFLNGNTKKIIRDLIEERNFLSINEEFEKASEIQNKISAIELITGPFYKTRLDLDIDPNFSEDLRRKETIDLKKILNENNVNIKTLERIECFDISNISGTNATGSMVVFINAEKESSLYRKFKIRSIDSPNDFAMMEEVLRRRLKHEEWTYPGLIIVDGGKGQISSALKALKDMHKKSPIIGLAKREEIIITSDFKEIILPKDSNALKLIMRIRDEAHRFAISYHKKLRSKSFLPK